MTPETLLKNLEQKGVRLTVRGDRIAIVAPVGVVTSEMKAEIARLKPALILLLTKSATASCTGRFRFVDGLLEFGDVPVEWTPSAWAVELRRKAERCQTYRPDIAEYYLAWATNIEARVSTIATKARKE